MITIYLHGCSTCGINSVFVRRIKAYGQSASIPVEVMNSKYDEKVRDQHADLLMSAGMPVDSYPPIVVQDDRVIRLRDWQ